MNRKLFLSMLCFVCVCSFSFTQAQKGKTVPLFAADLSDAEYDKSVWTLDSKGVITASKDDAFWTTKEYENFELTLEFKNDVCTNSGVVLYCTNKRDWIPNSMEIQIADDHCSKWINADAISRCGAVYGHLGPPLPSRVKKPGEWNKMKIIAKGKQVTVELNGKQIVDMDMNLWMSGTTNPDGTQIPAWLPKPYAGLPTKGYIGFQGKHGDATIWFRNIKIKEL
ncbi:MAG: DUF1080 domain-containing protein [Tannerella sp.]|jgi:hypothetical protein|nr:DUF1080 domain-containing protein [Tannerella sp.]